MKCHVVYDMFLVNVNQYCLLLMYIVYDTILFISCMNLLPLLGFGKNDIQNIANVFKWIPLSPNNHITSWCFVLIEYINNNNIIWCTKTSTNCPNCNQMAVGMQLLIDQAPNFFSVVYDTIESVSAPRNTLNAFWWLGDHDDPRDQKFSYNEVCWANKPTTSRLQQVKLVLN